MGALHDGHISLIRRAKKENNIVVTSIFVNPLQFGPTEDLQKYPRPKKNDKLLLQKNKVDIIIYPSAEEMYPKNFLAHVEVEALGRHLCGASRPGHFRGVTTVVCKLLNIVNPDVLYLGQKDAQQALILAKMVEDLNMGVKVSICPTVRAHDGLALSSRNQYLSSRERSEAVALYQALRQAKKLIEKGERKSATIISHMRQHIRNNSSGKIDYIQCVDTTTLAPLKKLQGKILIALAVKFGNTRLIDNIMLTA